VLAKEKCPHGRTGESIHGAEGEKRWHLMKRLGARKIIQTREKPKFD
jgi:hypothetical protein